MDKYEAIQRAFKAHAEKRQLEDVVPQEWFSARDYAGALRTTIREAQRVLRSLLDDNAVETKTFRVKTGTRIYPVIHYKTCDTTTRKSAKHR